MTKHEPRRATTSRLCRAAPAALLLLAVAGCGLRRAPGLVLAPHDDAVLFGQVLRDGRPLVGQLVKLYDDGEQVLLDSLRTDPAGRYGFGSAPAGGVMVKASSSDPLDFSYVRFIVARRAETERDSIPPMELRAYGCGAEAPAEGVAVATPNPGAPVAFRWTPMSANGPRYKVRLADPADSTVWESSYATATSASFNGIGNAGPYAGRVVPAGAYAWRVKVRFATGVTAATRPRAIAFTAAAPR